MQPYRPLRSVILFALLSLAACNPGAFDDLLAREEETAQDAASPDGASAVDAASDARAQLDARMSEPDADAAFTLPFDGGPADASSFDATALDASRMDADAGEACFAAGNSLISYFPLNGSPGDAVPPAQGGASVIAVAAEFGVGQVGSALHAGELAIGQSRLDGPGALTISAWLRLESAPTYLNAAWLWTGDETGEDLTAGYWLVIAGPSFRAENARYLSGTAAQGHLGFALTNGTDEQFLLTDAPFPLLRYVHVVATFDGTRARLYLDGAIMRDEAQLVSPRSNTTPLRLASPLGGAVAPLTGELDEVAFFDRAFTSSEVSALHQQAGVVCTDQTR